MKLETLIVVVSVTAVACVATCSDGTFPGYSEGVRSGKVIKVSRKGLIWKSWEATILMEGMVEKTNSDGKSASFAPNVWECSTRDEEVAGALDSARAAGSSVEVAYSEYLTGPFWLGTSYEALEVTP